MLANSVRILPLWGSHNLASSPGDRPQGEKNQAARAISPDQKLFGFDLSRKFVQGENF